jgi:hypothetical protein
MLAIVQEHAESEAWKWYSNNPSQGKEKRKEVIPKALFAGQRTSSGKATGFICQI